MSTDKSAPGEEEVFQAVFIPKQRSAPLPVEDDMVASIATYPPLDRVSQLPGPKITFTAVLEIPRGLVAQPWELALWHSGSGGEGGEWVERSFDAGGIETEKWLNGGEIHAAGDGLARLYFVTGPVELPVSFTVKFRQRPEYEWRWIRDEQAMGDGVVVVEGGAVKTEEYKLPDLIRQLNPDLTWKSHMSQCPNTQLWSIQAFVPGTTGESSAFVEVPLGTPWGKFLRWFALVRLWTPWLAPRHGKTTFGLDKDAVLCSFLSPEGKHLTLLGLALGDVITLFRSDSAGNLALHIRSDSLEDKTGTVLVAVGDTFESANAAVMYHARSLVNPNTAPVSDQETPAMVSSGGVQPNWYEDWHDGLGYCEYLYSSENAGITP